MIVVILTVTPNPALDRTIILKGFKLGQVNRVIRSRVDVGGKGINVAKNIKALGGHSICLGFMGKGDDFFVNYLKEQGIASDFTTIQNPIRMNIKLVDEVSSTFTDLNEPGTKVTPTEIKMLLDKITQWAQKCKVLVLAGSLPPGVNKGFYGEVITKVKHYGVKVILDTEKEALKSGIEAAPYLIKPNIHELSELVGKKLKTQKDILAAVMPILKKGIKTVVVSMGPNGSLAVTRDIAYSVPPLDVKVKSTAGAGDAMVAGLALALENGMNMKSAVKLASAAAACAVTREGPQPIDVNICNELIDKVKVKEIPF